MPCKELWRAHRFGELGAATGESILVALDGSVLAKL
jgi:hypothetical protein